VPLAKPAVRQVCVSSCVRKRLHSWLTDREGLSSSHSERLNAVIMVSIIFVDLREVAYLIVVQAKLSEVTSEAELMVAVQRLPILRGLAAGSPVGVAETKEASAIAPRIVETRSMAN
jgi:hypothetical protein